jgi:hypothetical protein
MIDVVLATPRDPTGEAGTACSKRAKDAQPARGSPRKVQKTLTHLARRGLVKDSSRIRWRGSR